MVEKDALQEFLGWLLSVVWDLLKCLVSGCEDGVIGLGSIEKLDEVIVLVNELCKLGSVFALADELLIKLA